MRFPDLPISTMAGATVTSATVEIRDLMCESTSLTIECYPFMGSSWTEDSTWATISSQSLGTKLSSKTIKYSTGASLETIHRYSFNITAAVQDWVDGDVALSKGIIFKATSSVENGSTYNYRTFASFNRASYKPSLSVTYNLGISLDYSTIDVDENQSFTLTATTIPAGQTVTWSSSNTTVATVSSTGKISARKAGKTTITAKLSDGTQDACTVYVTLADGIYYIENVGAGCYLGTSGSTTNGTNAYLKTKDTSATGRLSQLWKITYVSGGEYTVRPMNRQASGLYKSGIDVNVTNIPLADTFAAVPTQAQWQIYYAASGYAVLNNSSTSAMLMAQGTTNGSNVGVASFSTAAIYLWNFERAYGVFLYDKATMYPVPTSTTKYLIINETLELNDWNVALQTYGNYSSLAWSSSNTSAVNVNASSGKVTAQSTGEATITISALINGTTYSTSFIVKSSVVRMSGYELDYEEALWNYSPVIDGTNCYAYAFDIQVKPNTNELWWINPGDAAEQILLRSMISATTVVEYVSADAEELGFVFESIDKDATCDIGCYKVALVVAPARDYHWYRQNPDGTWSHKLSDRQVESVDSEGLIITDPYTAYKDYTSIGGPNYTEFVGYFQVTPVSTRYSNSTRAASINSDDSYETNLINQIDLLLFDYITYDDLVSLLGEPNRHKVYNQTFEYDLSNGSVLVLEYTSSEEMICINSYNLVGGDKL